MYICMWSTIQETTVFRHAQMHSSLLACRTVQCTQDAELDLFMDALDKLQHVMAELSSDHKFSGHYITVTISGVAWRHVNDCYYQ